MAHQQLLPLPIQRPCLLPCNTINSLQRASAAHKPILIHCLCSGSGGDTRNAPAKIRSGEIPPNALRRKVDPLWRGGFSLGVDLGMSRTGLALGKGFSPRPLSVLEFRGNKLELRLLEIAEREEVDEFIIGLPKSHDGRETPQSNKVRSVAGRFAVRAAERGWRVYLQDEHGTSMEALDSMIDLGVKKSARQGRVDAFAAMMVLKRYFSMSGYGAELVLPKQLDLQLKLLRGPAKDKDFFPENVEA
ncbi:putative pre-16S rRNA nuclease [Macadamia integrifolia]|uniref:putative pre-16S rRNA nuclease n=1 Tax=Macadamia integrifolia TaxID=60698 RepID=UPI001C4F0AFC|nr:putative pre-16S rRNA nuclease [Macadamia integrifolia]XP_042504915.1 putative pre-16S rRNA nuclease [Macadamia integrifolia]XP_042504916.1 putative pre-16S rRNA nuclease [Macadamia integrifolia]